MGNKCDICKKRKWKRAAQCWLFEKNDLYEYRTTHVCNKCSHYKARIKDVKTKKYKTVILPYNPCKLWDMSMNTLFGRGK